MRHTPSFLRAIIVLSTREAQWDSPSTSFTETSFQNLRFGPFFSASPDVRNWVACRSNSACRFLLAMREAMCSGLGSGGGWGGVQCRRRGPPLPAWRRGCELRVVRVVKHGDRESLLNDGAWTERQLGRTLPTTRGSRTPRRAGGVLRRGDFSLSASSWEAVLGPIDKVPFGRVVGRGRLTVGDREKGIALWFVREVKGRTRREFVVLAC